MSIGLPSRPSLFALLLLLLQCGRRGGVSGDGDWCVSLPGGGGCISVAGRRVEPIREMSDASTAWAVDVPFVFRGGASHWRGLSLATAGVATQFYVTARDAFDNRVAHHDADAGAAATERRLAAAAHGLTVRLVGVDAVAGFVRQSAPCDLEAGRDHGVS